MAQEIVKAAEAVLTVLALTALSVGAIAYVYKSFRKGKKEASDDATGIYKNLNEALEKKVDTLKENLDEAIKNIDTLNDRVEKLTTELKNYESLIVKSLIEYWDSHPSEAKTMSQTKEVNKK